MIKLTEDRISPSCDWASETFDPLKALYARDFRVSNKEPKVHYQNLAAFESAFKRQGIINMGKRTEVDGTSQTAVGKLKESILDRDALIARRFQPHQIAIRTSGEHSTHARLRHKRNLFAKMSNTSGPMAALYTAMVEKRRVLVKIRNEHGIRGSLEGDVLCFDKHWNLLMANVLEVWQRRKYKYGENKMIGIPQDCSEILHAMGIVLPKQQVKSVNRKNVEIRRHLEQLFVRGEHIALIVLKPKIGESAA